MARTSKAAAKLSDMKYRAKNKDKISKKNRLYFAQMKARRMEESAEDRRIKAKQNAKSKAFRERRKAAKLAALNGGGTPTSAVSISAPSSSTSGPSSSTSIPSSSSSTSIPSSSTTPVPTSASNHSSSGEEAAAAAAAGRSSRAVRRAASRAAPASFLSDSEEDISPSVSR